MKVMVMVIVKASKASASGEMPSTDLLTAMGNYSEELVEASVMLAGEGLHPTSNGKRVGFTRPDRTVVDGPFTETKELIAVYCLCKVRDMDEAVARLKRRQSPQHEVAEVEIRPVFEAHDFGAKFTPGLRAQAERLMAEAAKNNQRS